jgi:hypothetical protein
LELKKAANYFADYAYRPGGWWSAIGCPKPWLSADARDRHGFAGA